jgi:ABC-2 type transport system ATP-binding protein
VATYTGHSLIAGPTLTTDQSPHSTLSCAHGHPESPYARPRRSGPSPALAHQELRPTGGRPLDLSIAAGEFYALLGPNGAGKTTTLRLVAGLLPADAGDVRIFGIDARRQPIEAKRIAAWLPDEPMLYDKLDPIEYLEFVAGLWSVEGRRAERLAEELLESLDLWPHRRERCEGLSSGMKQKLALAGAFIPEPRLLMLDEPLTGLDAAAARQVKDILTARVRAGATIIMTTHILEVAERLASRIGIIARGRMIAEGTLEQLRGVIGTDGATKVALTTPSSIDLTGMSIIRPPLGANAARSWCHVAEWGERARGQDRGPAQSLTHGGKLGAFEIRK